MNLGRWWQILDLYEVILVWPLAILTAIALSRARTRRGRVVAGLLLILLFLPFIQRGIGDVYFDYLCKHEAGEFIYRTVDNVEGILQMRPRDGSKDYFDRMAMGDIPEDPWGHTNAEAQQPWSLIGSYQYIETKVLQINRNRVPVALYHESMHAEPGPNARIARYFGYDGRSLGSFRKEFATEPQSHYGFTWRGSPDVLDWLLNIYPGEVLVQDIKSGEVLAAMRGFFRVRPIRACPAGKHDLFVIQFVEKVLKPVRRISQGNSNESR